MSEEDQDIFCDALDKAVQDAISQTCSDHGRMSSSFIGLTRYVDFDGVTGTAMFFPNSQPVFDSLGLVAYMKLLMDQQVIDQMEVPCCDCDCDCDDDD